MILTMNSPNMFILFANSLKWQENYKNTQDRSMVIGGDNISINIFIWTSLKKTNNWKCDLPLQPLSKDNLAQITIFLLYSDQKSVLSSFSLFI